MSSAPADGLLKRIERILEHEGATGCQDRAVTSGLGKAVAVWRREAGQGRERQAVARLARALEGYDQGGPEERRGALRLALEALSGPPARAPKPASPDLAAPVTAVPGVSTAYARRLGRLNVQTVHDLLYLFPRRYDDYSQRKRIAELVAGEQVTLSGRVWETASRETRRGLVVTTAILSDGSGTIPLTWFNQAYLERQLKPGREIVVSGRVETFQGRLTLNSPEWEPDEPAIHTGGLIPVYPLTQGLRPRWLRGLVRRTLEACLDGLPDPLPPGLRRRHGLLPLSQALQQIHFPEGWPALKEARRRLAFEELLYLQLGVLRQKREWQGAPGVAITPPSGWAEAYARALPFALTGAQRRVIGEILADLAHPRPMSRLLQGDVGSGKTVVALAGLLAAVEAGHQAAFMAPTEILAEQHFQTLSRLLDGRPVRLRLLKGSLGRREKEEARAALERGEVDIVVGTHALIQEGVSLPRLGLAVVDEQHRFGVRQRHALRQQGYNPHLLVMSATPIPRSLAHTLFGDLDLSVIDELPPVRKPVQTHLLAPGDRQKAYDFIRREVQKGYRAFVICPLVEESEAIEARAAIEEHERLSQEVFPELRLELLHGRLPAEEKQRAMERFATGQSQILVSTPVVEVGVDVPEATVMLIESADRFGLAQLHQFRGRVGRGEARAYCLLLSESESEEALERLRLVASTHDGFELAAFDLRARGPGHLFGTYQTGRWELKVARLGDLESRTLDLARREAEAILAADLDLAAGEHGGIARAVANFWQDRRFGYDTG